MSKFKTVKGMHDILPDDQKYWNFFKKSIRHHGRQAGFRRITTPVLEDIGLISRTIGESSDIVQKEMFSVPRGDKNYVLRPENTASIVRSYIEHGMSSQVQPVQLYYIEPMFRAENPQKGRYRQFFQYGLEILGESDPALDAQLIETAFCIFEDLGIRDDIILQINSIGDIEDRNRYKDELVSFFSGKERTLTQTSRDRLKTNPLRILDTKNEDERLLLAHAPKMEDFLSDEAKEYHETFKEYLTELNIPFTQNNTLVRGLDYYNRTVFEFSDVNNLSFAYGGGGRYDGLVQQLGGVPTPAVGLAVGMERVIEKMKQKDIQIDDKDHIQVFVAQIGPIAKKKSLSLLTSIRHTGINALGSMGKSSIIAQMKYANKFNADICVLVGEKEVREHKVIIKDMKTGQQKLVPEKDMIENLVTMLGKQNILHFKQQ